MPWIAVGLFSLIGGLGIGSVATYEYMDSEPPDYDPENKIEDTEEMLADFLSIPLNILEGLVGEINYSTWFKIGLLGGTYYLFKNIRFKPIELKRSRYRKKSYKKRK